MSDSDLIKLYSQRILALAADIPHAERLAAPMLSATRRAPLCGSMVTVDLVLDAEGRIADFGQEVRACALGQASAAIAGARIIGLDRAAVALGRDQLAAMLDGSGPDPTGPFAGYDVLRPAHDYKNRHASILLVLDATLAAFAKTA